MTPRRKIYAGLALAAVAAAAGCLDALAPGAPHRAAHLGVVPVFEGAAGQGIPSDVDSIVVTIHNPNPPPPDTVLGFRVEPGQDSIVLTIAVPLSGAETDTRTVSFAAIRSSDAAVLYSGTQDVVLKAGVPAHADSVRLVYVGPGQNIESIAIRPGAVALAPGDSASFDFTALDSSGATIVGMPVLWRSRAPSVVTVGPDGVARGVTEGETYVVVISGARASVKDSAQVVVSTSPVAIIGLAPASATFTGVAGGANPAPQTVAVTNTGLGALAGLNVSGIAYGASEPTGWLTATLDGATAPATLTLQPATGSLAAGTYHATVSVASAQASNSPQTVAVTFTVTANPTIVLSPTSVTFSDTALTSDPAPQTVSVTNTGGGSLTGLAVGTINYASGSGWLTASLDQSTAPATLTLTVAKGVLAAGTYTATVPITSPVAGNSPQTVSVTFAIAASPLASIDVTPGHGVIGTAGTLQLAVQGFDATGGIVPTPGLRYVSRSAGIASVDSITGLVTATGNGAAVIVASAPGGAGTAFDSILVAVAAPGVAVALPLANGRAFLPASAGDTVHVVITVDIAEVSGEVLGSYNAQLDWDPGTLQYVRATALAMASNTTFNETATAAGQLRFGAADPNGVAGPGIDLVDIVFVAGAAGGSPLTLALTDLSGISPTFTQMLTNALVLSTGVQVK